MLPDNLLCRWRSLDDASLDLDNEDEDKDEDEDGNGDNVNEDDAVEGSDRAYNDATRSRGWVERESSGSRRNEGGRTTTTTKTTRSTKTREEGGEEGQRDGDVVVLSTIIGRDDDDTIRTRLTKARTPLLSPPSLVPATAHRILPVASLS